MVTSLEEKVLWVHWGSAMQVWVTSWSWSENSWFPAADNVSKHLTEHD